MGAPLGFKGVFYYYYSNETCKFDGIYILKKCLRAVLYSFVYVCICFVLMYCSFPMLCFLYRISMINCSGCYGALELRL